jgi:hypothetical protein
MNLKTLVSALMESGINEQQADQVIKLYKRLKLLKFNAHDGYQIVHGGLFEKQIILNAVKMANQQ